MSVVKSETKRAVSTQDPSPKPSKSRELTYWLTRDSDHEGRLDSTVDVWLARPTRFNLDGGGCVWICDEALMVATAKGDVPARYASWTLDQCFRACRVYPDTDRECIRVGE